MNKNRLVDEVVRYGTNSFQNFLAQLLLHFHLDLKHRFELLVLSNSQLNYYSITSLFLQHKFKYSGTT